MSDQNDTPQNETGYVFGDDWFSHNLPSLNHIFEAYKPQRILEVGSYEGRSACYFIEKGLQNHDSLEIRCIDTWLGGREHIGRHDMELAENRFDHNLQLASTLFPQANIIKYKGFSHAVMMALCAQGFENYFDFIYVDGSHEAPDVLLDALLAHRLVRQGGIIAFDDYMWSPLPHGEQDHYLLVKPAVDHYVNTYQRKVHVLQMMPLYQLYVQKLAD
ncbi:MAG: class I SAM-dependent methyltransferase [Conchiformibius sp.]|nr:class I SAM-dependent methyltransferase [Conchiformibius sp.]